MKFHIVRSTFLEGLKKVQNVVPAKGSMLILQNVLIRSDEGKLVLTTTDLDISIRTTIPCEIESEGSTTLPVKLLFNAISKSPEGKITVDVGAADCAFINAGSAEFRINGLPDMDFPQLPEGSDSFEYVIPQATFREMLRKTCYAASQDDTRRTLHGVLMSLKEGKVTMVATDGRRLAMVDHEIEIPQEAERDIVLPCKLVNELQRSLGGEGDARITIEKSQISFNFGDTQLYSKLLDDKYPNYRQVIPEGLAESVTVDRLALLQAMDRVSVMSSDKQNSVLLVFDSNQLLVSSKSSSEVGSARDVVPIKYDGERIEMSFNPGFVCDPLKAIDEDDVEIRMSSSNSPAIITCSVPFIYVMMPLRNA